MIVDVLDHSLKRLDRSVLLNVNLQRISLAGVQKNLINESIERKLDIFFIGKSVDVQHREVKFKHVVSTCMLGFTLKYDIRRFQAIKELFKVICLVDIQVIREHGKSQTLSTSRESKKTHYICLCLQDFNKRRFIGVKVSILSNVKEIGLSIAAIEKF